MAPVVVLGSNLAQDLFGSGEAVGQTVRIKNQTLRVIGVLTPGAAAPSARWMTALVPISVAQQRLLGRRTPDGKSYQVSAITLAAQNSEDLPAIQQRRPPCCGIVTRRRRTAAQMISASRIKRRS
ncbi:ABC transporter permease [Candidatus Amarolinea dominans]|uniref:ABC transporter permease n=1 Tax=Candidatus Amarolinea dominans TaxID=3140696 RepID=UPI0031358888|nr:ABC transporter permease [Anaerolineae bacterium]